MITRVCYSHNESLQAARSSVTDRKYGTELERVRIAAPLVFSRHRKRHKIRQNKIRIMLSHAGKEAREVYKTLPWAAEGDDKKFAKVIAAFRAYCEPQKKHFMRASRLLEPATIRRRINRRISHQTQD